SNPEGLAATVATLTRNLTTALTAIRAVYHGRLIGVTYYPTNYADPTDTVPIPAINGPLAGAGRASGGVVAGGAQASHKATEQLRVGPGDGAAEGWLRGPAVAEGGASPGQHRDRGGAARGRRSLTAAGPPSAGRRPLPRAGPPEQAGIRR